ncbi:hypothetical protein GCM10009424_16210 [Sphingomonas ursincola]
MLIHGGNYATYLVRTKAPAPCDGNRVQPQLDGRRPPVDMDMRGLVRFVTEEIEPKTIKP